MEIVLMLAVCGAAIASMFNSYVKYEDKNEVSQTIVVVVVQPEDIDEDGEINNVDVLLKSGDTAYVPINEIGEFIHKNSHLIQTRKLKRRGPVRVRKDGE